MQPIRLVHIADVHLGFTGNTTLVFNEGEEHAGRYVRQVDIELSLQRMTQQVLKEIPKVDLVVVAGDLFHHAHPMPRAIAAAAEMVSQLVSRGIEVVVVDGNHEVSNLRHTGSPTTFLRRLGAHVVNDSRYIVINGSQWRDPRLQENLAVHALSSQGVMARTFENIAPLPNHLNILVTHGRVEGMNLYDSGGRKADYRIPVPVLRQPWHYVALGDWHTHYYQPIGDIPAYYAGSLEGLNYGEASKFPIQDDDPYKTRGAIDVRLALNEIPIVTSLENTGCRPLLRLKPIDAMDLGVAALTDHIEKALEVKLTSEALVLLEITNCALAVWERIDHDALRRLIQKVRRCEIRPTFVHTQFEFDDGNSSHASLDQQWEDFLVQRIGIEEERDWFLHEGKRLIELARDAMNEQ